MAGLGRCDPTGGTVGCRDLSVEGGGQLQGDEGSAGPPMVEVARIDLFGVDAGHPDRHIYACGPEQPHTLAPHPSVGVDRSHHHPAHPRGEHRIDAGWRPSVMSARLERHRKCPIGGGGSDGGECRGLGVRLPRAGVTRDGEEIASDADDGSANPRIGVGSIETGGIHGPSHQVCFGVPRRRVDRHVVRRSTSKLDPARCLANSFISTAIAEASQCVSMSRCWLVATPIDTETIG